MMVVTKAVNSVYRAIRGGRKKGSVDNVLNRMLYSQLANNPVTFYNYDKEDFIEKAYAGNAEVYTIIKKITDKTLDAPHYLYIDTGEVKSRKRYKAFKKSADNHPLYSIHVQKDLEFAPETGDLYSLLLQPNENQTWGEMMELFRIFYFVQGEAFLYRETGMINDEIALSLHVAPANIMTPVYGGDVNSPIRGWKIDMLNGEDRELEAKDVFHMKMANPVYDERGSQLRGMSPLKAGIKQLTQSDKGMEAWVKQLENEGVKGMISPDFQQPEAWFKTKDMDVLREALNTIVNGSDNRGKVTVAGKPVRYHNFGLSPTDLAIVAALKHAEVKLCNLWGVPPVLFEANPTYQNKKEGLKEFVSNVVLPYLTKEEDALNRWLVEPFKRRDGVNYVFDYDTSQYEELRPTKDFIEAVKEFCTVNEIRVMQGFDTKDEPYADEVFVDMGKVPLSDYSYGQEE